jgi:hypothetical protein
VSQAVSIDRSSSGSRRLKDLAQRYLYALSIVAVIFGAGLYGLRKHGILACKAAGYDTDRYLAYCQADNYADYDHGAFWFNLEPRAVDAAINADVLFLGNSRMQFGLSTQATTDWFTTAAARYYLLGFSYNGNVLFEQPLLQRLGARAKLFIINLDLFFETTESPPARIVMRDSAARGRHEEKRRWQTVHKMLCGNVAAVCGNARAFFRAPETGAWTWEGGGVTDKRVSFDHHVDEAVFKAYTSAASAFLSTLSVPRECVILTMVPTVGTNIGTAQAVAQSVGVSLIAPEIETLNTFDESHLDRPSAQRWSAAFFEAAAPQIRRCLNLKGDATY